MKSFSLALIAASSAAVTVTNDLLGENTYEHEHVEYGEADKFADVIIEYEEIEYSIDFKTKQEVRTRQIPVPYIHVENETKY